MDVNLDYDWKKKVGFPINYESGQSSDDEFDTKDVVFRNPPSSSRYLLADGGDGSEADLLGTTPPRSRIRDKEKRRTYMGDTVVVRAAREKRDVVDAAVDETDRYRKRGSQKLIRSKERDWKLDMSQQNKADSLPSPNPVAAVPPLVESCSRFMSLTSRPKCRQTIEVEEADPVEPTFNDQTEIPASRVTFHKTFSMLINMGNVEKGCRRTISREEQVWQNELKDLIWLELQAKIAGRTLAQQDCYLCTQRKIVPTVINNILEYKFVNDSPCSGPDRSDDEGKNSQEDYVGKDETSIPQQNGIQHNCLSFDCQTCSDVVGRAMKEVFGLLEAYYDAVSLYPSTKAMTVDHPLVATPVFKNRFKAMCLWFNTALSMRLKMLAVRRLLRSMKMTNVTDRQRPSKDSEAPKDNPCTENPRVCQVRFNCSGNSSSTGDPSPTGSHNSDASTKETEDKPESEGETRQEDHDSGVDSQRNTNHETPEIVIDSRYSSANTAETNESGYMSSPESPNVMNGTPGHTLDTDVFNVGVDDELTRLRLLGKCPVSLYRNYHQEMLKTQGVRRCMMFIIKLRKYLLSKVALTLEKPDSKTPETEINEPAEVFQEHKEENQEQENGDLTRMFELRRYGCWSTECLDMGLPSYRAHFLLLNAICLEALHDYLSLRLDAAPDEPSCLTIKQLMTELKEGLDIATEMRVEFVRSANSALAGQAVPAPHLLRIIHTFDDTIETVLKLYLSFLTKMSEKEPLRRGMLQAEWGFTAKLARRVRCAHNLAPPAFSIMASNQLKRLVKQFNTEMKTIKGEQEYAETEGIDPDKHTIYAVLRALQGIYARNRSAVLGASAWARVLAARLARAPPPSYLTQRQGIFEALMGLRDTIMVHIEMIMQKTNEIDYLEPIHARVRELLLQVSKLGFELHRELYQFGCGPLRLTAERQARPASLQPPPRRRARLPRPRPGTVFIQAHNPVLNNLQLGITKELHQFVHESSSTRAPCVGGSPPRCPPRAPPRSRLFLRGDSVIEDAEAHVFDDKLLDGETHLGDSTTHTSFELLLSGQPSDEKVELRREDFRLANTQEQEWASRVARAVIEFAKTWMRFVLERCDRGRGLRPRWASQGLEFLMLACDPCNTKHLTDEEFEELKQLMDGCISHVIGSRPSAECTPSPRPRHRLHSPFPSTTSVNKESPPPSSLYSETDPMQSLESLDPNNRSRRVLQAIQQLDEAREEQLRAASRVGRVQAARTPTYTQKLRHLTFKWQRGLKIGAGSFGKVYTIVNTESGQLLAMKELSIGAADRRAFQRAANELQVLEGVIHPHLVRYYGCELHREEMLIFMELCVEGSLEALIATSGALQEITVRRYTKQLLSAVNALHSRSIAHRDIKSGNIFLTNDGHCLKLGDFGCAVKIRANTTAPNELQGFVGTQAYMAPEVFMKSSGHGRAADIWSVGCVITEMASGKRPFIEYDSNYQIMFMVGMGHRPTIANSLSEEGKEFCDLCLTHDPDKRPRAHELMLHSFLLVKSDDDCKCEPAYLLT